MKILVSYYRGEEKVHKYLNNFEELMDFLSAFLEVNLEDFENLELNFFRGKEEERIKILEEKQ